MPRRLCQMVELGLISDAEAVEVLIGAGVWTDVMLVEQYFTHRLKLDIFTKLGEARVRSLAELAARHLAAPSVTAKELLERQPSILALPTGIDGVDKLIDKGFHLCQWTELVGASGSGKTQLCLRACTSALHRGLTVLYLDTANAVRTRRMEELLKLKDFRQEGDAQPLSRTQLQHLLSRMKVMVVQDVVHLCAVLRTVQESLQQTMMQSNEQPTEGSGLEFWKDLGLIVIDSLATLLLPIIGKTASGHGTIATIAQTLRALANDFSTAVATTNILVATRHLSGRSMYEPQL